MSAALIVVGAGTAGMAASVFAARSGARVVLIEASEIIGGTTNLSAGQLAAGGTRLQRERGLVDSPDAHCADVLRIGHGLGDLMMIRLATALAPGIIDWMQEAGFAFAPECPQHVPGFEGYGCPRTYWSVDKGRAITRLLEPPLRTLPSLELRLATRLVDLLVDGDGAVTGVRIEDRQGRREELRAAAVALTTGGYAADPELFAEFTGGRRLVSGALAHNTGGGIKAARRIGAAMRGGAHFLPRFGGVEDPPGSGRFDPAASPLLAVRARPPLEIYVNLDGERFVREDEASPYQRERALLAQREMTFWIVFDARMHRAAPPLIPGMNAQAWQRRLDAHPAFAMASDLPSLATKMGVPAGSLMTTVATFNRAVADGLDPLGRRHMPLPIAVAPFFAVRNHGTTQTANAGLRVDTGLRVLRADGSPIRNLYAAGEILGRELLSGDAYVGGMTLTPALAFGRLIGERIADLARNGVQGG